MGIFKILFNLRLKSDNRPLEDFITEIFSYVLSTDLDLFNDFLIYFKINKHKVENYSIRTQLDLKKINKHESDSRPDMAIFLEKKVIFFENKINSYEGSEQLQRYAEHLDNITDEAKTLVYLTKRFDFKNTETITLNCNNPIEFIQIRWYEIYRFFNKYKSNPIVFELLLFMKQNNLSMNNQFNPADIITLTNFTNVRKMMDETMSGSVSDKFKQINKDISQPISCMTQLRDHDRYIFYTNHKEKMWCGFGYWMNSKNEKDYPDIGFIIEVGPQSAKWKEITSIFESIIKDTNLWEGYNLSNPKTWAGIYYRKSLQSFLSDENQIEEIKEFFIKGLEQMEQIYKKYDKLPIIK